MGRKAKQKSNESLQRAFDTLSKVKAPVRRKTPYERLASLCRELDVEMDGVNCPASAAACLMGIREVLNEIDDA